MPDVKKDEFERCVKMAQEEWFRNHVASPIIQYPQMIEGVSRIEQLRWGRKDSSVYLVCYLRFGSTLFVTGDLGSAVYRWGRDMDSFKLMADTHYGYFASKYEDLQGGASPKRWSQEALEANAFDWWSNKTMDFGYAKEHGAFSSREDWMNYMRDREELIDVEAYDWGWVPDNRCIGHWVGLRMALQQLKVLPCPRDTDGDGNCGSPVCPNCGPLIQKVVPIEEVRCGAYSEHELGDDGKGCNLLKGHEGNHTFVR